MKPELFHSKKSYQTSIMVISIFLLYSESFNISSLMISEGQNWFLKSIESLGSKNKWILWYSFVISIFKWMVQLIFLKIMVHLIPRTFSYTKNHIRYKLWLSLFSKWTYFVQNHSTYLLLWSQNEKIDSWRLLRV